MASSASDPLKSHDHTYAAKNYEGYKVRKEFLLSYDQLLAKKVQLESQLADDPDNRKLQGQLKKIEKLMADTSYFHNVRASSNVQDVSQRLERRIHRIEARIGTDAQRDDDQRNLDELRAKVENLRKQEAEYPTVSKVAAKGVNLAYRLLWGSKPNSGSDSDS